MTKPAHLATLTLIVLGATLAGTAGTAAADHRLFGVMADAGVPDGGTASLVFRPLRAIRLHAGIGHNAISQGMRAGITLVPLSGWLSPTVSVDVGTFPEGDANPLAQMVSGDPEYSNEALDSVGYDFVNLHAGLEFGRERATFYVHAGMSQVSGALRGIAPEDDSSVSFSDDPQMTIRGVSARIGLIVYIY
jgi:hypothetical protein